MEQAGHGDVRADIRPDFTHRQGEVHIGDCCINSRSCYVGMVFGIVSVDEGNGFSSASTQENVRGLIPVLELIVNPVHDVTLALVLESQPPVYCSSHSASLCGTLEITPPLRLFQTPLHKLGRNPSSLICWVHRAEVQGKNGRWTVTVFLFSDLLDV